MLSKRLRPRLIDGRSRVALPKEVLRELGVAAGDYVAFEVLPGEVVLRKLQISLVP